MNNKFYQKIVFIAVLFIAFFSISKNLFADNLQFSVKIPAKATDFQLTAENLTAGSPFPQDSTLEYQITYGSDLGYATQVVIEANWSQGTIAGSPTPSVDILDYVVSSASKAYNNTSAVVDTENRKITWTISSFPAETTDQTVTFSLKTNSSYTGGSLISFNVTGVLTNEDATLSNQAADQKYLFNLPSATPTPTPSPTPTSTPTPGPTATPVPGATSTPSPTPTTAPTPAPKPAPEDFANISVETISQNDAAILITTGKKSSINTYLGLSPNALVKTASSENFLTSHKFNFTALKPDTKYYFKLNGYDEAGKFISSDVFTFKTAVVSEKPQVDRNTFVVISGQNILFDPSMLAKTKDTKEKQQITLVIPAKNTLRVKFSLAQYKRVKQIKLFIYNKILGIGTAFAEEATSGETQLMGISQGIYTGEVKVPAQPGDYEVYVRIIDTQGNIAEEKISDVKVIKNLTILNEESQPLEGARVLLSIYNGRTKTFETADPIALGIANPNYSDINGEVNWTLAQATYRIKISAHGYKEKTVAFTLGQKKGQEYPAVKLKKEQFSILTTVNYYGTILSDFSNSTKVYVRNISNSNRFFELNALVTTLLLTVLTFISFATKAHIHILSMFDYLLHHIKIHLIQRKLGAKIKGIISDENTNKPLGNADVFLIDSDKGRVVTHTKTNDQGIFSFIKLTCANYKIEIMKENYEPIVFNESEIRATPDGEYILSIKKRKFGYTVEERIKIFTEELFGIVFEALLIVSFVFELSLGYVLGWQKVALFMLLSFVNLSIWLIHLSHLRNEKNIF